MAFVPTHPGLNDAAGHRVDYRTRDITATAGSDYTATSGTLTFAPGETESFFSVPIIDDDVEDNGEEFAVLLSNVSAAQLGDTGARGIIYNEEDVLAARFPQSPYASTLHKGPSDRPQVIVAFSEAVRTIAANTPSAVVTGGTISPVRAHTEDGLSNAWIFSPSPPAPRARTAGSAPRPARCSPTHRAQRCPALAGALRAHGGGPRA